MYTVVSGLVIYGVVVYGLKVEEYGVFYGCFRVIRLITGRKVSRMLKIHKNTPKKTKIHQKWLKMYSGTLLEIQPQASQKCKE